MHVWSGRSPDFKNKKYMVWVGPGLLALIALPFSFLEVSIHREGISNHFTLWGSTYLLPQSGLPHTSPGNLPDPGIEPNQVSCIAGRFFTTGEAQLINIVPKI